MEEGEGKKPLTFNGIEVLSRRQNAGKLSSAVLNYETKEDLAKALTDHGFGREDFENLQQAMAPIRGQKGAGDRRA